jgi:hypothetical protein
MSKISRELVNAMKFFVPHSLAKHQFRLYSRPLKSFPKTATEIIQQMPALMVANHLPVNYSAVSISAVIERRVADLTPSVKSSFTPVSGEKALYLPLCTLNQDESLGFTFPNWKQAKFSRELSPNWLNQDGQKLYDYCLQNDLRPVFDKLYRNHSGQKACRLMIRWQREHFDKLLGLPEHPLFAHRYQEQAPSSVHLHNDINIRQLQALSTNAQRLHERVSQQVMVEHEQDLDEESDRASFDYIVRAKAKLAESAATGDTEACIFIGSEGVAAFNCFGDSISNEIFDTTTQEELYKLFNHPLCHDAIIARGLCRWASGSGLTIRPYFLKVVGSQWQRTLYLSVSWKN